MGWSFVFPYSFLCPPCFPISLLTRLWTHSRPLPTLISQKVLSLLSRSIGYVDWEIRRYHYWGRKVLPSFRDIDVPPAEPPGVEQRK
jgi:hypothetical protein